MLGDIVIPTINIVVAPMVESIPAVLRFIVAVQSQEVAQSQEAAQSQQEVELLPEAGLLGPAVALVVARS